MEVRGERCRDGKGNLPLPSFESGGKKEGKSPDGTIKKIEQFERGKKKKWKQRIDRPNVRKNTPTEGEGIAYRQVKRKRLDPENRDYAKQFLMLQREDHGEGNREKSRSARKKSREDRPVYH